MKTKIHIEDNGACGATIHIGNEHMFTVGKDFDELWKNIDEAMICTFGEQARKEYKLGKIHTWLTTLRKITEWK